MSRVILVSVALIVLLAAACNPAYLPIPATGILEAASGTFLNIGKESVGVKTGDSKVGAVRISKAVLESDVIISLPRFKTHTLTQLTGAIKNCFGYIKTGCETVI